MIITCIKMHFSASNNRDADYAYVAKKKRTVAF